MINVPSESVSPHLNSVPRAVLLKLGCLLLTIRVNRFHLSGHNDNCHVKAELMYRDEYNAYFCEVHLRI